MTNEAFISALLDLPIIRNAQRSPDGKYIACEAIGIHSNVDVFYLSTQDPKLQLIPLTKNEEYTSFEEWFPDSTSIIVSQDKDGNERTTYYQVSLEEPNKLIPLTELDPEFYIRGCSLSPDGKFLFYSANYNFSRKTETETPTLIKHDLANNEVTELMHGSKPYDIYPEINKSGDSILYNRSEEDPAGYQYWLINVDGTENREILNFGPKAKIHASWHPDGEIISFTTDHYNNTQLVNHLAGLYNVKTQEITWVNQEKNQIPLHTDHELVGKDLEICRFDRYDSTTLILGEVVKTKTQYYLYNMETTKLSKLPSIQGNFGIYNRLSNGNWLLGYYASNQPATIVSASFDDLEHFSQTNFKYYFDNFENSDISQDQLVPAKEYEWTSIDGLKIHGWYYSSPVKSDKLIVFVHGGPTSHSSDNLNVEIQYYLSRGFNVLDPNYRGSTGYGVSFREKIKEEGWGGKEQADIAYGVMSLIQNGKISKGKVGITGTSYGGYSSWYAITKYPDVFDISIPVCGMTDLVVDYEMTRPDLRSYSEEMMGGSPKDVPERYYNGSPINFINNIKGKLLIIQGANDPNVHPANVTVVEEALRKAEIEYERSIYDDEGHGIIKKENRKRKFREIADFVASWIE